MSDDLLSADFLDTLSLGGGNERVTNPPKQAETRPPRRALKPGEQALTPWERERR